MCDAEQGIGGNRSGIKSLCHCWHVSKNVSSVPGKSQKNSNQASKILSIIGKRIENKENHIFL